MELIEEKNWIEQIQDLYWKTNLPGEVDHAFYSKYHAFLNLFSARGELAQRKKELFLERYQQLLMVSDEKTSTVDHLNLLFTLASFTNHSFLGSKADIDLKQFPKNYLYLIEKLRDFSDDNIKSYVFYLCTHMTQYFFEHLEIDPQLEESLARFKNRHPEGKQLVSKSEERAMDTKITVCKYVSLESAEKTIYEFIESSLSLEQFLKKEELSLKAFIRRLYVIKLEKPNFYKEVMGLNEELSKISELENNAAEVYQKLIDMKASRTLKNNVSSYQYEQVSLCPIHIMSAIMELYGGSGTFDRLTKNNPSFQPICLNNMIGMKIGVRKSDGEFIEKTLTKEDCNQILAHLEKEGFYFDAKTGMPYFGTFHACLTPYLLGNLDQITKKQPTIQKKKS